MRIAAAGLLALFNVATCALAQETLSVPAALYERPAAKGRAAAAEPRSPGRLFALDAPRRVSLEGLPQQASLSLLDGAVAIHRETPASLLEQGEWSTLPDGRRLWRVAVESPGAGAIRLHFTSFDIGGGQLWLSAGDAAAANARSLSGRGPLGDGEFWSASVTADTVWVEYVPAADRTDDALPFSIDRLSHYFDQPAVPTAASAEIAKAAAQPNPKTVAPCHLESRCYPEYANPASGVARLLYERNGFGYVCSGALLNTTSQRFIPYLLTADHCIQNDAEARSLQTSFFFEANICGGATPEVPTVEYTVLGAKYLASGAIGVGDYSMVLLSDAPDKALFLGWTTADIPVGTAVVGIHHPAGTYKRISFGQRVIDEEFRLGEGDNEEIGPADRYWKIEMTEGLVQGGSSGSPLLNANNQVVGMLSVGPGYSDPEVEDLLICDLDPFEVFYGRFVNGFPQFRRFLDDATPAALTFPANGATLPGPTVDFSWNKGTSSDEFKLHIGTTPGGRDLAVEDAGNVSFHRVNYLPTDGRRIYVRFHYKMLGAWRFTDYAFTAASDNGRKVTIRVANKLLYPVQVKANGSNLMMVAGGATSTREIAVPETLVVTYDMIRPVIDGAPAGVPVSGYFPGTGAAMGTIPFTITNATGAEPVFAPVIYNGTGQPVQLTVNSGLAEEQSCNCTAVAGANGLSIGYYPLRLGSNVRATNGAASALYQNFSAFVEAQTGILRATFTKLQ